MRFFIIQTASTQITRNPLPFFSLGMEKTLKRFISLFFVHTCGSGNEAAPTIFPFAEFFSRKQK